MTRRRAALRNDDKRPPMLRLESLVAEKSVARSRRILFRIRQELDQRPAPGPWIDAAQSLAERGLISANAVFYFVEIFLECVTFASAQSDAEMRRIQEGMQRIERAHGLSDGEYWLLHEAPAEWLALHFEWEARDGAIRGATLRSLGHEDIADLLEHDTEEFEARATAGHIELWGPLEDEM